MRLEFEARFKIPINGTTYTVGLGTRESFDGLGPKAEDQKTEGVTSASLGIIAIADDVPDHRRFTIFCHELVHAAFGELTSAYPSLALCETDKAYDSEENMASFLGPIIASTFGSCNAIEKLLTGPIRPKKATHQDKSRATRARKGSSRRRGVGRRNTVRRA